MSQLAQISRFAVVGVIAAAVDMAVVEAMIRFAGADPYSARVVSYLAAATAAWAMNRHFTFRKSDRSGAFEQWLRYLGSNLVGGLVNYAVYALLIATLPVFARYPFAAVAVGSLAGMAFNYTASRQFVFRSNTRSSDR